MKWMGKSFTLLVFILLLSLESFAGKKATAGEHLLSSKAAYFIENNGQLIDQYANPRNDIDAALYLPGVTVFIGEGKLHYQWAGSINNTKSEDPEINTYRLDIELIGANKNALVHKEDGQAYFEHFSLPHAGGVTAGSYGKIVYKDIYPGIDWVLYADGGGLKYDFIVHPGADPGQIKLKYNGATTLKLENGALIAATPFGEITETPPYCYESVSRRTVSSKFVLSDNTLQFETGKWNGSLVIDPVIEWVTFYGGDGDDIGTAVTGDAYGNTYVAGYTSSINVNHVIATAGANQVTLAGGYDGFLVKFTPEGARAWGTYFGGSNTDFCYGAACDKTGNIYVAGTTFSNTNISTLGAFQAGIGGAEDAFLMKFNSAGAKVWGTYFGGLNNDAALNVTTDDAGFVYFCGETNSPNDIVSINATQPILGGGRDGFVAKFNGLGQRQWSTYYGGSSDDEFGFLSCDLFGNVYCYGSTFSSSGIATSGSHQSTPGTSLSSIPTAFITKFNISGNVPWSTYYGGLDGAVPGGIATSVSGSVYISGSTTSTNGIATAGSFRPVKNTGSDGFVSKFTATGGRVWGTYIGDAGQDFLGGITFDKTSRHLYISGKTSSTSGISTPGSYQPALGGGNDALLAQMDTAGNYVHASYLGGALNEDFIPARGSYIHYNTGRIYLAGHTSSPPPFATPGAHQETKGLLNDVYVATFSFDTVVTIDRPFNDTLLCEGSTINVAYSVNFPFEPTNNFTVHLSDPVGNFGAPINIGTVTASNSGTVSCTIPATVTPGTSYRIRIVATNPAYTSADNQKNIRIDRIPATPLISNGSPGCIGDTLKLAVTNPQPGVSYLWTGPGFFGYAQRVSFNSASTSITGSYTITPSLYACTGADAMTTVTVKPTPEITTKGNNSPVCEGETVFLNADSDMPGSTFTWSGPAFSSNLQNPLITNSTLGAGGRYTVKAIFNGCESDEDTVGVQIKRLPVLTMMSNLPVCEDDTLYFSATDTSAQTTYTWTGPGGFSSSTALNTIPGVTMAAAGSYYITALNNGCQTNDTLELAIKQRPKPVAGNNGPLCSGETLSLTVTQQYAGTLYNWYGPNDFNKTEQNPYLPAVAAVSRGLYRVIANLDGCIAEDTTSVVINQAPKTVLSTNAPVYNKQQLKLFASNNLTGAIYLWRGPWGFTSTDQNPVIDTVGGDQSGYYSVITSYMGCTSVDSIEAIVYGLIEPGMFSLYPNPNNGTFTVKGVLLEESEVKLAIYDAWGKRVYEDAARTRNKLLDKTIKQEGSLASGVYVLKIETAFGTVKKKFTVVCQ